MRKARLGIQRIFALNGPHSASKALSQQIVNIQHSIRWRLVVSYVFLTLLTIGVVGLLALTLVQRYASQQEEAYLAANASVVARRAAPYVWPQVRDHELSDLARTSAFWSDVQVRILDANGQVLADSNSTSQAAAGYWIMPSDDPEFSVQEGPGGTVILTFRNGQPALFLLTADPTHPGSWPAGADPTYLRRMAGQWGGRFVLDPQDAQTTPSPAAASSGQSVSRSSRTMRVPIPGSQAVAGYVELSNGPDFGADVLPATRRAFGLAALGATLLAAVVGLVVSRGLTAPVHNLTVAAALMSSGDLSARAPVLGRDEIGLLARQFNQMAAALQTSFAALEAERDALRRFIADASHELRTPITALRTFNELLQGPAASDPPAQAEFLAESRTQLARLEWITSNLLDLSRLDAGLVKLDLAGRDVGDLLDAAAAPFRVQAQEREITLTVNAPSTPLTVVCDLARIEMVLTNLLDNALKFTPEHGRVTLGAASVGESVHLWVEDSGPGISADDLPHIFERFYRGHSSARGSGLGLAIAQSISAAHGGQVMVESQPGHGSRFTVALPAGKLNEES